jgi:hypothetical protein
MERVPMANLIAISVITCPHCGSASAETIPSNT